MKKHIGSTIALVLGGLALIGGLSQPGENLIGGANMILGALAYRSAKRRKLGEAKQLLIRELLEFGAIIVILASLLYRDNLKELIATDPVHFVIPVWAIIAYLIIVLKRCPPRNIPA